MIGTIEALEALMSQRESFLRMRCKSQGGTISDFRNTVFFENGGLSMQDLVQASGLSLSTLSRQINKTADKGFISKIMSKEDQRRTLFTATAKGRSFIDKVNAAIGEYDEHLFKNWTEKEIAMYNIMTNRILKNISK